MASIAATIPGSKIPGSKVPGSNSGRASLTPRAPSPGACAVCGSSDVAIDEVFERGLWRLGECRRCHHRWTEGPFGPRPLALARSAGSETAAA